MNRNLAGFYHDPPLWVGNAPTNLDVEPPMDLSQFTEFSETALSRRVASSIDFQVSREGLFSFDFKDWPPGCFPETTSDQLLDFEVTARLMLSQASVMNALLVFLYSSEIKMTKRGRQWMVVTPELRLPLGSLDGNSGMGFGNQSVAHLAMSRFSSTYRPGLPIRFDGRITTRSIPIEIDVVRKAINNLGRAIGSTANDNLGLLELYLRAGKAYQDHNHASAVITYWAVIERLLQELWSKFLAANEERSGVKFISAERKKRLNDNRTFTAAVIAEQLSFARKLPADLYESISKTRKARNDWMHGNVASTSAVQAQTASTACQGMLKLVRSIDVTGPPGLSLHG